MMKKTILIVDPIHSAGYLSKELSKHNIRSIAVFSNMSNISEFNRPSIELFDRQVYIKDESVDDIVLLLKDEQIDFVINGCDQHVPFAECLANKLTPKLANKIQTSKIRQSKFLQQEELKKNGMPFIQQLSFDIKKNDVEQLKYLSYPVFAKPQKGGGSIGIFSASTCEDLVTQLNNAPKMVNFDPIDNYLIQEFISGEEIILDFFSINGTHKISCIHTYKKVMLNGVPVYRTIEPICDSLFTIAAVEFAKKTLNLCGLDNGFSHVELFHLGNNEFRLIEINPRISGASGCLNIMASKIGMKSQDKLLEESLLDINSAESLIFKSKGFTKSLLLYNHEDLNLADFESYLTHFVISKTKYNSNKSPDLTDLRQIVIMYNESKDTLDLDCDDVLKMDIF